MTQTNPIPIPLNQNQSLSLNPQQVKVPDTKPKYQQFTFWLPIVTPLLNFGLVMFAAKYPGIADAIKKSGLDNAILTIIGGSTLSSAAYIFGEKHKDGQVLSAMVSSQVPQIANTIIPTDTVNEVQQVVDIAKNVVDDVKEEFHYRDNSNAG